MRPHTRRSLAVYDLSARTHTRTRTHTFLYFMCVRACVCIRFCSCGVECAYMITKIRCRWSSLIREVYVRSSVGPVSTYAWDRRRSPCSPPISRSLQRAFGRGPHARTHSSRSHYIRYIHNIIFLYCTAKRISTNITHSMLINAVVMATIRKRISVEKPINHILWSAF